MDSSELDAPESRPAATRPRLLPWLLALVVLAAAGYGGWRAWPSLAPQAEAGPDLSPEALDERLLEAEQALTAVRRGQQTLDQRLTDTQARTGLLRDEVLAVGQRAAIVEDNLRELSTEARDARQALLLDEAELLLSLAQTRLELAGDLDGAVRATALAEAALASLTDPALVNLRQTLAEELAALKALPTDPRRQAARDLDAFEAALPVLASPQAATGGAGLPDTGGFRRLLDALIQVRPSGAQDLLAPADRSAGEAALGLELALARSALDRRDEAAFRASLARMGAWLARLYAPGPGLAARQRDLQALSARPLLPQWPALGTALAQLRSLRRPATVER